MEAPSVLPDVRVVQIAISQLFQMVDLLTRPESVRSQTLLRAIRDPSARRRARLVENMLQVMQAISSLGFLRTIYPVPVVNRFARDVWTYSNPVRPAVLRQRLDQVERWLVEKTGPGPPREIADLREQMRRIRGIEPLFPYPEDLDEDLPSTSAGESPARKVRIFCCYAHKDEKLRLALDRQLGVLQRKGFIEVWSDHRIMAGEPWEDKISENLEKADLILLLISPLFVASDYSWGKEMKRALERSKEGTATVVPVLLRQVINWQETPFASLQTVPEKAVTLYKPHEAGLNSAAEAISRVVKRLRERP